MLKLGYEIKINDTFPYECILESSQDLIPLFTYFANYLESYIIPKDMLFQ